jgi:hypothetical protein
MCNECNDKQYLEVMADDGCQVQPCYNCCSQTDTVNRLKARAMMAAIDDGLWIDENGYILE